MKSESRLWHRLDTPGHDACRFRHDGLGWVTEGHAVFLWNGRAASLSYRLRCDDDWVSRSASVQGWIGEGQLAIEIARSSGEGWTVDGREEPALAGLSDIDLGFTPATNTNTIRRLDLDVGAAGATVAIWLDDADWTVKPLPQSYRHATADSYDYASPLQDFHARILTDDFGAVAEYPSLWTRAEPRLSAWTGTPALAMSAPSP